MVPFQIGVDSDWKQVSAGAAHTLAVKNDGTLWAWGSNGVGQLGIGNLIQKTLPDKLQFKQQKFFTVNVLSNIKQQLILGTQLELEI
jgi:alpha-tubulin suppressor-like RCC1 family protein